MGRAPCCSKVGLHRGAWSPQEDALLSNYIQANGEGQWRSLPQKAGLLRCGKSCRLRWMNYLRPGVKRGNITAEEEDIIIHLQSLVGNRWSLIAGKLPGRTDNEIKNHWNTNLHRRIKKEAGLILEEPKKPSKTKRHRPKRSKKVHPKKDDPVEEPIKPSSPVPNSALEESCHGSGNSASASSTSIADDDNNNHHEEEEEAKNIDNNDKEMSEISWSSLDQLEEQSTYEVSVEENKDPFMFIEDDYFNWDLSIQQEAEEDVQFIKDDMLLEQFYHEYLQLI